MGKPTEVEKISLDRLKTLANRLESGEATERDRDEALGTTLRMFAAEREMGLVSVGELKSHIKTCPHRSRFGPSAAVTVITVSGMLVGLAVKLFSGG